MPKKFDHDKELKKAFDLFAKRMEQVKKMQLGLFADMQKALDSKVAEGTKKRVVAKKKASPRSKVSSKRSKF